MKLRFLTILTVLLWSVVAQAQTHPCDIIAPNTLTIVAGATGSTTLTMGWCHNPANSVDPTNIQVPTGWAVYVDGVRAVLTAVVKSATANSAGSFYYSVTTGVPVVGTHSYAVAALYPTTVYAAGESAKSSPFTLTVNPPPFVPQSPGNLRVVAG